MCDRGTIDALAYWPGDPAQFWSDVGTSVTSELARYETVIHLRTPPPDEYNHRNPLRTETAEQAAALDLRIAEAWSKHPRRMLVPHCPDFMEKARIALELVRREVPVCCASESRASEQRTATETEPRPVAPELILQREGLR